MEIQPDEADPRSLKKEPSSPPRGSCKTNDGNISSGCIRCSRLGGTIRLIDERAVWIRQRLCISADLHVLQATRLLPDGSQEEQAPSGNKHSDDDTEAAKKRMPPRGMSQRQCKSRTRRRSEINNHARGGVADASPVTKGRSNTTSRHCDGNRATFDDRNLPGAGNGCGSDTHEHEGKPRPGKKDRRGQSNVKSGGSGGGRGMADGRVRVKTYDMVVQEYKDEQRQVIPLL